MRCKITFEVLEGALKGKESAIRFQEGIALTEGKIVISAEEHQFVMFGRTAACQVRFPDNDDQISRHQFLLEVNPPQVRIRDMGSRNGTFLNGVRHGGRAAGETPEGAARAPRESVALRDGDELQIGATRFAVRVAVPPVCTRCASEIPSEESSRCRWLGGTFLCRACRQRMAASATGIPGAACADCGRLLGSPMVAWGGRHGAADYCEDCWNGGDSVRQRALERLAPEPAHCRRCDEAIPEPGGRDLAHDYLCPTCRKRADNDPAEVLCLMLERAGKQAPAEGRLTLPGHDLLECLGKGGFGAVYRARRHADGQSVAVKVMLARVEMGEQAQRRFLREVEITVALRHPNIVPLYEHGSVGGAFYFTMEYIPGGNVARLAQRRGGRLSLAVAAPIILQALDGLSFAHAQGIVHRDLKPENLLLSGAERRWEAKIGDLGLARSFEQQGLSGMTLAGQFAGTWQFMPREQLTRFRYVTPPSDVWSLAATFYHLLTGQFPRDFPPGCHPIEVVLRGAVVPVRQREPAIPPRVAEIIDRALSDNLAHRFQSAAEMRQALASVL